MRRNPDHLAPNAVPSHRRGAFTLIELMIVIVVIAILMGLILPAVMSSRQAAKVTAVTTEIRGLEAAIAQFKNVFGIEPPSRIRLYEGVAGSPSWASDTRGMFTDPITGQSYTHDAERIRSISLINRIWPNFDFSLQRPLNSDADFTDCVELSGAECLVFFLGGGAITSASGTYALTGFSKNPANPLAPPAGNESREGPFFEFKPSQLRPSSISAAELAPVYFDSLPNQSAPYVYASSYEGRGYVLYDLYVKSADDLNDVYRQGPPPAMGVAQPQKNKSFQIISPGADGFYGAGGGFDVNSTTNHGLNNRSDFDNITNFHGGLLSR